MYSNYKLHLKQERTLLALNMFWLANMEALV